MNHRVFTTLTIVFSVSILVCLILVAFVELTSKESALLGILLTILSFLASWLLSHYFSEKTHRQAIEEVKEQHLSNLKTYALNAAEKVGTLSSELGKLSLYLQQEIDDHDGEESTIEELYTSAYERIESTIHIINTLKSVNDTYLSDWKGVIGEELDEKIEEQQERENDLKELVAKVEQIVKSKPTEDLTSPGVYTLSKEIQGLRKELNRNLNSVSGTFVRTSKPVTSAKKENIINSCPNCSAPVSYKQRGKLSSFKLIECKSCGKKAYAKWDAVRGFLLLREEMIEEQWNCPGCGHLEKVILSSFPGSKMICTCENCKEYSQIIRTTEKFNIHSLGREAKTGIREGNISKNEEGKPIMNEKLLAQLQQIMPTQPWPKGTHKVVAEKVGVDVRTISYHITELIRRGVFKPQYDGILYEPIEKVENRVDHTGP